MDWKASIRRRPGMYVGDDGPLNLVLEVLGNSFDQYLLGRCRRIDLRVEADGWVTVDDDGPGVAAASLSSLTVQHDTPTADGHRPHAHLATGVGLAVVNALSERLDLVTVRDRIETVATFARGEVVEAATAQPTTRASGTRVRFRADPDMFPDVRPPRLALARRLEELSLLSPGLALSWSLAGDATDTRGLVALVALDARGDEGSVAHHRGTHGTEAAPIQVEVALAFREHAWGEPRPSIHSFVNYLRTAEGGTHVDGLHDGVAAVLDNPLAREGLVAAVAVVLADVTFGNPSKGRLDSPAARPAVAEATIAALTALFERAPDELARRLRHAEARAAPVVGDPDDDDGY